MSGSSLAPMTSFTASSCQPFMKAELRPRLSAASARCVAAIMASLMAYSRCFSPRPSWNPGMLPRKYLAVFCVPCATVGRGLDRVLERLFPAAHVDRKNERDRRRGDLRLVPRRLGQRLALGGIGDHDDAPRLQVEAARRCERESDQFLQRGLGNRIGLEFLGRAADADRVGNGKRMGVLMAYAAHYWRRSSSRSIRSK